VSDTPIRILVADDHVVARLGLALLVERQEDMTVVAQAANVAQAVDLHRVHRPDVTLLDLRMPGGSGVVAIEAIRKEQSGARILVVSMHSGNDEIFQALRAGAQGYLTKDVAPAVILSAIREVHAGRPYIPEPIAAAMIEHLQQPQLSPREIAVLRHVARGTANPEIAAELAISESTVKVHVASLIAKLGARSRADAVVIALERGVIDLESLPPRR
jgi:two-component system, NarL family, response regulator